MVIVSTGAAILSLFCRAGNGEKRCGRDVRCRVGRLTILPAKGEGVDGGNV